MLMLTTLHGIGMQALLILVKLRQLYSYVFVADAILSWFLRPGNKLRSVLIFLTEPLVSLFRPLERRILRNSMFPISLAHLFAFFFLQILQYVLYRIIIFVL